MDFTRYVNTAYLDNIDWSKSNPEVSWIQAVNVPEITKLDWLENFSEVDQSKSDSLDLSVLSGKNPYYIADLENNVDWAAAFRGLGAILAPNNWQLHWICPSNKQIGSGATKLKVHLIQKIQKIDVPYTGATVLRELSSKIYVVPLPESKIQGKSTFVSRGKYVVLLFYPADFTFVCPTEILAYSERADELRKAGAEVIGISCDSAFTHQAYVKTDKKDGGLGPVNIPLVADKNHAISK